MSSVLGIEEIFGGGSLLGGGGGGLSWWGKFFSNGLVLGCDVKGPTAPRLSAMEREG